MGWSKTDLKSVHNNICISAYCNAFKNVILNLIRFELNHAFNVDSCEGLKFLTRLTLRLSHLTDHKFRHNFQDCVNPICSSGQEIETSTNSSFTVLITTVQNKPFIKNKQNWFNYFKVKWPSYNRTAALWQWKTKSFSEQIHIDIYIWVPAGY